MAQWENRAQKSVCDLKVAGSNPAGQLLNYFHNIFPVLTKIPGSSSKLSCANRSFAHPGLRPPPPPPPPVDVANSSGYKSFHESSCFTVKR